MKVVHISTYNIECGISTYFENLVSNLKTTENHILAEKINSGHSDTRRKTLPYYRTWSRLIGDFESTKEKILEIKPDLVHIQFEYGLFYAYHNFLDFLRFLRNNKIKIVLTLHSILEEKVYFTWFSEVLNSVDGLIVHTENMRLGAISWGALPEKITVIPHGVERVNIYNKERARGLMKLPKDKKIILSFGFISANKNLLNNLKIMDEFNKVNPNFLYVVRGFPQTIEGNFYNREYAEKLVEYAKDKPHLDVKIEFIKHSDIPILLSASDIVLCNYLHTCFSASGNASFSISTFKPTISSKAYLLDVLDESTSIKINTNDSDQVKSALTILSTDNELYKKLQNNCKQVASQRYWNKIGIIHEEYYDKVLFGNLNQIKDIKKITSNFYDKKYFNEGGIVFCDENNQINYSGYLNQDLGWDAGWELVLRGFHGIFPNFHTLLDVGSGRGSLVDFLVRFGVDAKGIDYSDYAVKNPIGKAWDRLSCIDLRNEYKSEPVEVVVCLDTLEHIYQEDIDIVLEHIKPLSKKWFFFLVAQSDSNHIPVKSFSLEKFKTPPKDRNILKHIAKGHVNIQNRTYWLEKFNKVFNNCILRDDLRDEFLTRSNGVCPNWEKEFIYVLEIKDA
jgi:glycosyltransferase involved in cell wall biosynthesis